MGGEGRCTRLWVGSHRLCHFHVCKTRGSQKINAFLHEFFRVCEHAGQARDDLPNVLVCHPHSLFEECHTRLQSILNAQLHSLRRSKHHLHVPFVMSRKMVSMPTATTGHVHILCTQQRARITGQKRP